MKTGKMKGASTYIAAFLLTVLVVGCKKEETADPVGYRILSGSCGTAIFMDRIGVDRSDALDSLVIIRQPLISGGCPGNPCHTYRIEEIEVTLDFHEDEREFVAIRFVDAETGLILFSVDDILDSYGNYYSIYHCSD